MANNIPDIYFSIFRHIFNLENFSFKYKLYCDKKTKCPQMSSSSSQHFVKINILYKDFKQTLYAIHRQKVYSELRKHKFLIKIYSLMGSRHLSTFLDICENIRKLISKQKEILFILVEYLFLIKLTSKARFCK